MKKYIIILFVIAASFQACKKDKQSNVELDGKKHAVTFSISGFEQVIEPSSTTVGKKRILADTSLHGKFIVCRYYKSDGAFVSEQFSTYDPYNPDENENYGIFKTELATGDYTAIFYAYKEQDEFEIGNGYIFYNEAWNDDPKPLTDIYYKRVNFSISSQIGDISQSVTLQRYYGTLAVEVSDALPTDIKSIETRVWDWNAMNIFEDQNNTFRGARMIYSTQSLTGNAGITNYLYNTDLKILSTGGPVEVIITAYGTSGIITRKVIPNVNFYKNTKTILRGKLFDSNQTGNNAGFSTSFETFLPDSITSEF